MNPFLVQHITFFAGKGTPHCLWPLKRREGNVCSRVELEILWLTIKILYCNDSWIEEFYMIIITFDIGNFTFA